MNAAELAVILDHVDPALPIIVRGPRGPACHVDKVDLNTRRMVRGQLWVADVVIEGGRVVWHETAPPFELTGRYRRGVLLEERLGRR